MNWDLTKGSVVKSMLLFAIPMILGDLLQQCYNIADTLIVGQFLGRDALAAVASAFTLMTFLTSIILGLCMGSGALFSMRFGQRDEQALRENLCASFVFIALITVLLNALAFVCLNGLRTFLRVPAEVWGDMREYLFVIFMGIPAVFLYNYFTYVTPDGRKCRDSKLHMEKYLKENMEAEFGYRTENDNTRNVDAAQKADGRGATAGTQRDGHGAELERAARNAGQAVPAAKVHRNLAANYRAGQAREIYTRA